jgi:DNA-binding transcriptional regulator LsrR (DeoR family)
VRIDLHTHSARSDGLLSPTELVRLAAEEGRVLLTRDRHLLRELRPVRALEVRSEVPLEQLRDVVAAGAVGQICLRFLDAHGNPVASPLDDLVTGITWEQLRSAKRRWIVAGGPEKHAAIRAVLLGGWADTLVTDAATARWLLSPEAAPA